jgi:hypothetical protein
MQRRSFLRNAACVGACASLFVPIERVFAADVADTADVELTFERLASSDVNAAAEALQVRVAPRQLATMDEPLRVRAWFATDTGTRAFDLASFGRQGASQRLRFAADPHRLIGFELGNGQGFDDCTAIAACRASTFADATVGPGRYRLSLRRDGQALATVDLDLGTAAA